MTIDTDIDEISTEDRDESRFRSLESRALRGTYFVVAFYGIGLGMRFVGSIILTRLFVPELFGLMTLLTTIIVGLNLFSHIGLEDNVIQNPRGDDETFLNTTWTIQVLRGLGLWLVMVIAAWPAARFYDPRLLWLLPVVGFGSVISGFSSPSLLHYPDTLEWAGRRSWNSSASSPFTAFQSLGPTSIERYGRWWWADWLPKCFERC